MSNYTFNSDTKLQPQNINTTTSFGGSGGLIRLLRGFGKEKTDEDGHRSLTTLKFENLFHSFVAYKEADSDAFVYREALKIYSILGDDECELKIKLLELLKECKL